jgi:hypothetical protein
MANATESFLSSRDHFRQETVAGATDDSFNEGELLNNGISVLLGGGSIHDPLFAAQPMGTRATMASTSFDGEKENTTVATLGEFSSKAPSTSANSAEISSTRTSVPPRTTFLPTASSNRLAAPASLPHDDASGRSAVDAEVSRSIIPHLLMQAIEEKSKVLAELGLSNTKNVLLRDANAKLDATVQTLRGQLQKAKDGLKRERTSNEDLSSRNVNLSSRVRELEGLVNEQVPNSKLIQAENDTLRHQLATTSHELETKNQELAKKSQELAKSNKRNHTYLQLLTEAERNNTEPGEGA